MIEKRDIVILGSGVIGAMSAAYLAQLLPKDQFTLRYFKYDSTSTHAPLHISLHADIRRFHRFLKIKEVDFIRQSDAVFSLGECVRDANAPDIDYINTYCPYGLSVEGVSFLSAMYMMGDIGSLKNWEDCNLPATLIRSDRFNPPDHRNRVVISDYTYGYQINPERYAAFLEIYAGNKGVEINNISTPLKLSKSASGDFQITLANSEVSQPHLILDAGASNRFKLNARDIIKSSLPDMRYSFTRTASSQFNNHVKQTFSKETLSTQLNTQSESLDVSFSCASNAQNATKGTSYALGYIAQPWQQNVIKLDHYKTLPLLGAPLRLVQIALERLGDLFPTGQTASAERREYNHVMNRACERFEDFQTLWLSNTSFGQSQSVALSEAAAYKRRLFKSRGRLAKLDDDSFFDDHWIALFLGQGIWPDTTDMMSHNIKRETIERFRQDYIHIVTTAAAKMPSTRDFIAKNCSAITLKQEDVRHAV